jgi:TRAP-type mannitol/chloroaromatic compound transport system substrate-binding protein
MERAIAPSTRKRTIVVGIARNGPPAQATLSINYGEFADMKVDVSWSRYSSFKVSIDRVNQGRVAVLNGIEKDSNGQLRIALNAGAFGPGDYMVAIEGLTMRRESVPVGWFRISVAR